jgi:uncharacterized coiled-coil protein SlyX
MAVQNMQLVPLRKLAANRKYGITEKKKAELDALTLDVLDAQQEVEQFQAIVTSLTDKLNNFQGFLATAEANRTHALDNRNLFDQLAQSALDLQNNSEIAFNEAFDANQETQKLARMIKSVISKLIYSADVINKLYNLITRKKALNPLISDDLITMIGTAGKDANNAVSLTLIALKSVFAAEASNMESEAASSLEYLQAIESYELLTADQLSDTSTVSSLKSVLYTAYDSSKTIYDQFQKACTKITHQLNESNMSLNKAQVKLRSLQSSLAAANAAAYAS